jgi:hypothetical protein
MSMGVFKVLGVNREVRVRGIDGAGVAYTVWLDPKHLDVIDPAPVERT